MGGRFVRKERLDGIALLNYPVNKVEDKLLKESVAIGDAYRFVQFMYSCRQKWDRRPFVEKRSQGKYRTIINVGISATVLELVMSDRRTFPEISITTYLQRQAGFGGAHQQVDPLMMPDRPEGDAIRQLDLRNATIVQAGQQQNHYGSMMANSSQQTHVIMQLTVESDGFLFHEKVSGRDTLALPQGKLPGFAHPNPAWALYPTCPGTTILPGPSGKMRLLRWDMYIPTRWNPTVHQLLPRNKRLAIQELFFIRTLRKDSR